MKNLVERLRYYADFTTTSFLQNHPWREVLRKAADALESRLAQCNAGDQVKTTTGRSTQCGTCSGMNYCVCDIPATLTPKQLAERVAAGENWKVANQQGKEAEPTYTRAEVQNWRDDVAHAAADIAKRGGAADWVVSAIERLATRAADPAQAEQASELPPLPRAAVLHGKNLDSLLLYYTADQMHEYARAAIQGAQLSKSNVQKVHIPFDAASQPSAQSSGITAE